LSGFFLQFKQRVATNYPELFEQRDGGESDYGATSTFGSKWGWYQSVYGLAKGDVTKFDEVTKLKAHTAFVYLAFEKEKNELERKLINKK
tara:strand:+ start:40 stop:309 length:270 start_codon:yes stop_codon:yes gene_type:complete